MGASGSSVVHEKNRQIGEKMMTSYWRNKLPSLLHANIICMFCGKGKDRIFFTLFLVYSKGAIFDWF